jgi:hypothetical protein
LAILVNLLSLSTIPYPNFAVIPLIFSSLVITESSVAGFTLCAMGKLLPYLYEFFYGIIPVSIS